MLLFKNFMWGCSLLMMAYFSYIEKAIDENNEIQLDEMVKKVERRSLNISYKEINNKILIDAPILTQFPELDRGCEITSLAMLLQFAGIKVDKLTLAEEIPKVPFSKDGHYGDPNEGFVGDIYSFSQPGYAVYHKPIEDLAEKYLPGKVLNLSGSNFNEIKNQLLKGKPVWVIVTSTFNKLPDSAWETWKTANGDIRITMREHSVLLTGFDEDFVYFNDPFKTEKNSKIAIDKFIAGWEQFGKQAISIKDSNLLEIVER
ncbi:C39 family peptidase [Litchfieldia salsa]|uniref:Uncharacterized protein YvpB n=1 Tax=Litchfieldia salsa TaxID=930152 RepID=A0A1H0RQJ6_9BACI|nr:C39 family peptidase [Litchfieldia salsa]SDP31680.1 Uncharacterized protein YvpB [Litchfieldia salsa]